MRADLPWCRKFGSALHHPQTNGFKPETLKARLNLLLYHEPGDRPGGLAGFIRFYNHERDHEGIVTPADAYDDRRDTILRRRVAQQSRTLARRVRDNRSAARQGTQGELTGDLSVPRRLTESQRR
jgi:hypothetical protein